MRGNAAQDIAWSGRFLCALLSLVALTGPAAPALLPPPAALPSVGVPDGFRVTLFASEPDVLQPIALAFDDRGRVWVAECHTYADLKTNFDTNQHDRIVIFEDLDRDGRFDRRKVFWDKATRLTSIQLGFGGVWALCAPHLLFIPDRNGDDQPDGDPEILLDGWDAGPVRHNIVNGLKWGPDGWLYGRHGIQATSAVGRPGTPPSSRTRLNCCLWRFHPARHDFEVVCQGGTNPWGHDWDEHGELFFINTVIGHLWHGIPGAYYRRMYGEHLQPRRYQLIDQHADHYHWDTGQSWTASRDAGAGSDSLGGGHAHSGLMIYLADNWPRQYRNALFTINFHGRRLNQERLERLGSGYVGRHEPDFLKFPDPWFRGIDLAYGPDGSVFVLDWSDTGECHENDSDGVHRETGRIYNIAFSSPGRGGPGDLAALSDDELVGLQLHPNDWFVRHARRLLQERAVAGRNLGQVAAKLIALFQDHPEPARQLRALWALHVAGGATEPWLLARLEHPNEHIRAWAVRLLADDQAPSPATRARFVRLAGHDDSGLVRLCLASALQKIPPADRFDLAAALSRRAEDAADHNLPLLLWYGVEPLAGLSPDLALALAETSRMPLLRQFIARRLTEDLDKRPEPVRGLVELASGSPSADFQLDILRGMAEALRGWRRAPRPSNWETLRNKISPAAGAELDERMRELSLVFGEGRALRELRELALSSSADSDTRRAALEQLVQSRPPDLEPLLVKLLTDRATAGVAARGLARFEDQDIPELVLGQFQALTFEDQSALLAVLASRRSHAAALLEAIAQGRIPRAQITASHARQIRSHGDPELDRRLAEVWGRIRTSSEEKRELMLRYKALLDPAGLQGADLGQGRHLFNLACASCHRLYGQGASIGPDLTGADRGNLDYLLENIVDPSAVVPADFRVSTLELRDDRLLSGVILAETDRTVTVQTPTERLIVERGEIVEIQASQASIMPEGLLEAFAPSQIRDLVAYLMSPRQVPLPDEPPEARP